MENSLTSSAKSSSNSGSSFSLISLTVIVKVASFPATSLSPYSSGNFRFKVLVSPEFMPTIPSTKPGINRPSSKSTWKLSPLAPGISSGSSVSDSWVKYPLKSTNATSPNWAGLASTGIKVALFSCSCFNTCSTCSGSNLTSSAWTVKPLYSPS